MLYFRVNGIIYLPNHTFVYFISHLNQFAFYVVKKIFKTAETLYKKKDAKERIMKDGT